MSDEIIAGAAIGGVTGGTLGGVPGALVGSALGGLLGDAYSKKPKAGNFATTLQNDLVPENVTLDAHQIYQRITTGPGTPTLLAANTAATQVSANFAERADQIAKARGAAAAAWQGGASTAADAATAPLADSFAVAQQQLAANAQVLDAEVTAFDHIRSQVEFVPATPPQSSFANDVNPFQSDTDAAINDYNAKAAKNVALYEAYAADTATARSQVPQSYTQPAPLSASATGGTRASGSPIGTASAPPPQVGAGGASQPAATDASAAAGGNAAAPPSPGGAPGGMPGGTAGQGGGASDPTGRQTPSATTPSATPGGVPVLPAARNAYAGGPLGGKARRTPDAQRNFAGTGPNLGGGPGAGGGPGSGSGVRGGPSVGTGPVPGQAAPGQQAGRGGAGGPAARGAAGGGGMPGAPAGRANNEEDQEHRRKYLIEPDDKDLFGIDEKYVPPVIGDNR